jgi:hypothetical protein
MRLNVGNACYISSQSFVLPSAIKMCKTVILSVVLYGYETSLHTETQQIEDAGGQSKGKEIPVQT